MAHLQKHKISAVGHLFEHFDRSAENNGNDILDRNRTSLNYNLAVHQSKPQLEFLHKRLGEIRTSNRDDLNVLCTWVLTLPKKVKSADEELFFKSSYDFLEKRYGKENVVSAYVHKDECTPHLHFAFVPVVKNSTKLSTKSGFKINYQLKCSAKEKITLKDLKSFHSELSNHVEKDLNYSVDIQNDATIKGNKSIKELKRLSATGQVNLLNQKKKETDVIHQQNIDEKSTLYAFKLLLDDRFKVLELAEKKLVIGENRLVTEESRNKSKTLDNKAKLDNNSVLARLSNNGMTEPQKVIRVKSKTPVNKAKLDNNSVLARMSNNGLLQTNSNDFDFDY